MITLPDFEKCFEYENNFYLSSDPTRLKKVLAHFQFLEQVKDVEGDIFEFGLLKGCSFIRFATFRQALGIENKKMIGFDTFGEFPETDFEPDKANRINHIEVCGQESIDKDQLEEILEYKKLNVNISLVEGDILKTLPGYLENNPDAKASLVHVDVDIYEPSKAVIETMYPRLSKGGIMIFDDYGCFAGETKAVDDYFKDKNVTIKIPELADRPYYLIKEED